MVIKKVNKDKYISCFERNVYNFSEIDASIKQKHLPMGLQ